MKTLSATLVAWSLALFAGVAAANPVPLSFSNDAIKSDGLNPASFNDSFDFSLAAQTLLSGQIITTTTTAGGNPWVNITSAYIQGKDGGPTYLLTETKSIDWDGSDDYGVEIWTLGSQWLGAGDWVLHVIGEGYENKTFEGYTATLVAGELPEPAALALVAVALSASVLARRRRVL